MIHGGEVVALVGPTGSGKSTLAALIARLYDPTSGTVRLDGVDLRSVAVEEVREAVSMVFEDNFLFNAGVADNLRVGRPGATDAQIAEAARCAQAAGFIARLPRGDAAVIGDRGLSLSGGQRQRLALARAILASPRVLVLDDATSAVDAAKERQILEGIRAIVGSRTVVVISHREATIALAERVVLLDEGRIIAEGAHETLLRSCPRYREILGLGTISGAGSGSGPSGHQRDGRAT